MATDLTQRPTEPGEFADDQTVATLENVHQLVESAALFGSLSRGGRLDEIVNAEVVFACVLEDGEALAANVLLRGRDPLDRQQFSRPDHGIRFLVFYITDTEHVIRHVPCY